MLVNKHQIITIIICIPFLLQNFIGPLKTVIPPKEHEIIFFAIEVSAYIKSAHCKNQRHIT